MNATLQFIIGGGLPYLYIHPEFTKWITNLIIWFWLLGDLHFLWTDHNDWTGQQYRCGLWQEQLKMLVVGSQTRILIQSKL